jgi:hypothetical protein
MQNNLYRCQSKKYIYLVADGCSSPTGAIANHVPVLVCTIQSHDPGCLISF